MKKSGLMFLLLIVPTALLAGELGSQFDFGPNGSSFQSRNWSNRGWTNSLQNHSRGDLTMFGADGDGHMLSDSVVVRRPDGSLYGSKFDMHIGPRGSYFGSGQISGVHQLRFGSKFSGGLQGQMSLQGSSFDGRLIRANVYQNSFP